MKTISILTLLVTIITSLTVFALLKEKSDKCISASISVGQYENLWPYEHWNTPFYISFKGNKIIMCEIK